MFEERAGKKRERERVDEVPTDSPINRTFDPESVARVAPAPHPTKTDSKLAPIGLNDVQPLGDGGIATGAFTEKNARWWLNVHVGQFSFRALYDTGASRTVLGPIGLQIAAAQNIRIHPYVGKGAKAIDGHYVPIIGSVKLPFSIGGVTHVIDALILREVDTECTLGSDFIRAFLANLDVQTNSLRIKGSDQEIPVTLSSFRADELMSLASLGIEDISETQRTEIEELLQKLAPPSSCDELGRTGWIYHDIDVNSARPIKQKYYPVSQRLELEMHEEVHKMLRMGIIRRSTSEWSSPVVMIRKPDDSYRFCIDYRKVNAVSRVCAYPLPYMDVILRKLQHAKYISSLDCSGAFWQIPLTERSIPITAFTVPGMGLFEFVRMPYGLAGGPSTFQMLADKIITPEMEPYAFAYLDDLIIVTETYEEHVQWLTKILLRVKEAGLTINHKKSKLCRPEIRYLGILVNRDGTRPDPERVRPILEYPAPKNLKQLRRFLGMASWYRKFLGDFASIAEPLTALTRQNVKYEWTDDQTEAFERVKGLLASAPVLARPDFSAPFTVECDASDTGLGSVLLQRVDGEDRVLCYASRVLTESERRLSVTERECLAVLWSIDKFRPYIEGYHFTVITDHHSLVWLKNLKHPNGKLGRWSLRLQSYDFDIVHRKGKDNVVPDALSRMYETEEDDIACLASLQIDESIKDKWYLQKAQQVITDPTAHPCWKIVGGRLYNYRPNPVIDDLLGEDDDAWKLVVPHDQQLQVLKECHEAPTAGHLGRYKTHQRAILRYYWPNIYKDIAHFVRNCQICQQTKVEQLAPAGLMGKHIVTRPWEIVSGDSMGPFPRSTQGNEHIIILLDLFTRWAECIPVRKINAKTVKRALNERVFLRYGIPERFLSDNGTPFKNKVVDDFLEANGVIHATCAPYSPKSNPTERVNRTFKAMITAFIEEKHTTWDSHLLELTFSYNTAVHEATRSSPAFLNYGRNPEPPHSLKRQVEIEALEECENTALTNWCARMEKLDGYRANARENSKTAQARQEKYYNAKHRDVRYNVGDKVWVKNRILSSAEKKIAAKLSPKYAGPYIIVAGSGTSTYRLRREDGKDIGKIAVADMKPCHDLDQFPDQDDSDARSSIENLFDPELVSDGAQAEATKSICPSRSNSPTPDLAGPAKTDTVDNTQGKSSTNAPTHDASSAKQTTTTRKQKGGPKKFLSPATLPIAASPRRLRPRNKASQQQNS